MVVRGYLAVPAFVLAVGTASAAPLSYCYDTPVETKATQRPFDAGGGFQLDGLFGPPSAVTHDFRFTAAPGTSAPEPASALIASAGLFMLAGLRRHLWFDNVTLERV